MSKIQVIWEGEYSALNSFAKVNRNISHFLQQEDSIQFHAQKPSKNDQDERKRIWISHQWPPRMTRPEQNGYWISMIPWEFGSIPAAWYIPMKYEMDEIWVNSLYNKTCYVNSGIPEEKIRVIPLGVDEQIYFSKCSHDMDANEEVFRFLYVGGTITRKGFDLLLKAYREAFTPEDQVCLVVKDHGKRTHYQGIHLEHQIRAAQADASAPPIQYIDHEMTEQELASLYRSCHCAVYPYRGEGFGLPIIESMACGTPVIVPKMGPAVEFCDPSFTYFVSARKYDHREMKIGDLETIYYPYWIEPDLDDLKSKMRQVYEQREQLQDIGMQASRHIRKYYTWKKTAEEIKKTLTRVQTKAPTCRIRPHTIVAMERSLILNDLRMERTAQGVGKSKALLNRFPDRIDVRIDGAHLYMNKEQYLEAMRLLVPLEKDIVMENEKMQAQYWTTLALCYCGIQSWSLAVKAFQKAAELQTDIRHLEISLLQSAIRSLRQFIGFLYQEIGDGYVDLFQNMMAESMYRKALAHGAVKNDLEGKLKKITDSRTMNLAAVADTLEYYDCLLKRKDDHGSIIWKSIDGKFPQKWKIYKDELQLFFLPGQRVMVIDDFQSLVQARLNRDGEAKDWDGIVFFHPDNQMNDITQLVNVFQWCNQHMRQRGTLIVHHEHNHEAFESLRALFVYGGWSEKDTIEDKVNHVKLSKGKVNVFNRHIVPILWQSPLQNASGYATEQTHFLNACKPYPFHVRILPTDTTETKPHSAKENTWKPITHEEPLIHYQASPAHLFSPPKAPISVGRTMFETDRLPAEWVLRLNELTEVWVPSHFNKETFIRSGVNETSIRVVPGTLDDTVYSPSQVSPYPLKQAKRFKFLSIFDWSIRKGWDLLLRAYMESFTSSDDVSLILKVSKINEPRTNVMAEIQRLKTKLGRSNIPHILILDSRLSEDEMVGLYAACDAFVLPTRGEGWGRPFMEAMAMQLPVIGTNWSGQLEFMNENNSYLIDVEKLVPVPSSMPAHFHGHLWAEPSLEHLKQLMEFVVQHPEEASKKGIAARKSLFPKFSLPQTGKRLYEGFRQLIHQYMDGF